MRPSLLNTMLTVGVSMVLFGCTGPESPTGATLSSTLSAGQDEYIITPAGPRHRSCVHGVENGARIEERDRAFVITRKDRSKYEVAKCKYPSGGPPQPTSQAYYPYWIEFDTTTTAQTGSTSFAELAADWTVPAAPSASYSSTSPCDPNMICGQVYFTFPGLVDGPTILQPILQYGFSAAGGGNYWGIASWACGNTCFWGPLSGPLQVSVGDHIHGSVVASNCSGGTCTWTITGQDLTNPVTAQYSVNDWQSYNWATGGAVEVYNLTSCSDYPANGVFFTSISLYDQSMSQLLSPPWGGYVEPNIPSYISPSCGFSTTVTTSTLNLYHNPPPLSATITGPTDITQAGAYNWIVHPSGGTGTYSYDWEYRDAFNPNWLFAGAGTGVPRYVDASTASWFDYKVTVTSGAQSVQSSVHVINEVGQCNPNC